MIEFEKVTKLYKTVIGVNDISLTLEQGAYGLLGPNGSGKTTLINLIMGQLRPTLGRLTVFGEDPWQSELMLNRIGLCPAIQPSYPFVTGLQWVTYLCRLRGFSSKTARSLAQDAMETLGMTHAMDRAMTGYSLGMRQRTVLAQAIAHQPELLILDEPFNGLDPEGRYEMAEYLKSWVARGGSLILASHILHEVEALNPSLLLISGGRLLASGSPEQVRSILADCPNSILIRCRQPKQLASLVTQQFDVDSVRINQIDETVEIETRAPLELLESVSSFSTQHGLEIREIRSGDESLQQIFSTLMRIHRGEVRLPG